MEIMCMQPHKETPMDNKKCNHHAISELLCVCETCKTPFQIQVTYLQYAKQSKVRCVKCGEDNVYVVSEQQK